MVNRQIELGSEYNLDVSDLSLKKDNLFDYLREYSHFFCFDSGRSALREVASLVMEDQPVLLPEYICESVINCFPKEKIEFYRIHEDFTVDVEDLKNRLKGKSIIFLMHYFGRLQPKAMLEEIRILAETYGCTIIEDTTHSFLSSARTIGDYVVCSIRKWMPISGGGIMYVGNPKLGLPAGKRKKSTDNRRLVGFILKDQFLKGNLNCNKEYRKIFADCERELDRADESREISDLNRWILQCISIRKLINRRRENAQFLLEGLRQIGINLPDYAPEECPFAVPLRVKNRDVFRAGMIEKRIYCAVHWPFDSFRANERKQAQRNAEELISLPIDQRYNLRHMEYLLNAVKTLGVE